MGVDLLRRELREHLLDLRAEQRPGVIGLVAGMTRCAVELRDLALGEFEGDVVGERVEAGGGESLKGAALGIRESEIGRFSARCGVSGKTAFRPIAGDECRRRRKSGLDVLYGMAVQATGGLKKSLAARGVALGGRSRV
jgi:hypothetical protein